MKWCTEVATVDKTQQCVQLVFTIFLPVYLWNINFTTLLTLYGLF